jgi:glucosamine-phosphate N-acetyltransferase
MSLPEGYEFRKLQASDFTNNYIETLKVLTTVGDISHQKFTDLFNYWSSLPDIFHPHVITDADGVVVATGMLLVERKLIHSCGYVGHIEDISVDKHQQGKKLGHFIITSLVELSKKLNCYKVILDCDESNVGFYEKCGLKVAGIEMTKRFI